MQPVSHAVISAVLAYGVYESFKSAPAGWACLLSGILIDIDHHIDYVMAKGKITVNLRKLFHFFDYDQFQKVYVFFHSWELMIALWLLISWFNLGPVWIGLASSLSVHLFCDQLFNPLRPLSYFLTYRIYHKFDKRKILNDEALKKNFKTNV